MSLDDCIQQEEQNHKQAVQTVFEAEQRLNRLYAEKTAVDELCGRLREDGVDLQIVQHLGRNEVALRKGETVITCMAPSLPSALFGAYTALRGEIAYAL